MPAISRTIVLTLCLILASDLLRQSANAESWWEDYPLIVQTGNVATARDFHANTVLCGAADDPAWGLYGQQLRLVKGRKTIEELHAAGLKAMTWIETYGTTGCYIAQLKKNLDGSWVKCEDDPTTTRVFLNHWAWHLYDGTGEVRWIGAHNYFNDKDSARPYTRMHERYGCPPMTYPDGRIAAGHNGLATDPRNSRMFDAGCAKDVMGKVFFEYGFRKVPEKESARAGLVRVGDKYAGLVSAGKDSACPVWADYVRASALHALDAGIDGFWCDNYSPWDSFSSAPVQKAFGEWSVAGFRPYLRGHFSAAALAALGVGDVDKFDVRAYLRGKCGEWGGKPEDLRDKAWKDPRWLDDPVWRAYAIYKRQTGTAALSRFYRAIKEAAQRAGRPEPLVSGNDIPGFSLGWPRGDLDMVSTELSWGWGLTTGARGLMPPPMGSYVPFYKLAREHAQSRFVNVWMYMPDDQLHKPNIADVLFYQGLANQTFSMPQPGGKKTAGDDETNAAFFAFVNSVKAVLGNRVPVEEIGVYYSSSSQLAFMCPGGFLEFNNQPHIFAYWGWGTALAWLHYQYRAVPEWKLTPETLAGLRALIIPNAEVFDPRDEAVLTRWVQAGGALIVTGNSGRRRGEDGNFDVNADGFSLAPLTGVRDLSSAPARQVRRVGKGAVLYLKDDIGLSFYKADAERAGVLAGFRDAIVAVAGSESRFTISQDEGVPFTVGLTAYQDKEAGRLFVDVNNVNIDTRNDTITPAPPVSFTVRLPEWLTGKKLHAQALSPDRGTEVALNEGGGDLVGVSLSPVRRYACVVIEANPEK